MDEELCYSVFLPRCERTFKWLESRFAGQWDTDSDDFDHEIMLVSFDTPEAAMDAIESILLGGSHNLH